jgi:hypothetical protein
VMIECIFAKTFTLHPGEQPKLLFSYHFNTIFLNFVVVLTVRSRRVRILMTNQPT